MFDVEVKHRLRRVYVAGVHRSNDPFSNQELLAARLKEPERWIREPKPQAQSSARKGFLQAATLRTVGQAGLATTLQILAQLRQRRQAALFSLEYGEPEPLTRRSADTRGEGHNDVAKVFMVSLLPSAKWPLPEQRHLHSELTVTEKSSVKSLAMALAARVAQLPSDKQAVALSVDLRIHQTVRWHRLLKAAYAVATAHEWQVRPKLQKPTRPFRCVASLQRGGEECECEMGGDQKPLTLTKDILHIKAIPVAPGQDDIS
ncbi:unnamed protein product [Symbiodinium microadriaticum]|nr:unnamed protein product [Symbiodinium microadriaticum]